MVYGCSFERNVNKASKGCTFKLYRGLIPRLDCLELTTITGYTIGSEVSPKLELVATGHIPYSRRISDIGLSTQLTLVRVDHGNGELRWFFDRERRGFDVSVREILDRNCSSRQVVGRINISGRNGEDRNLELYRFKPGKLERALIVGEIEIPKNGDFNKLLKEGKLSEKEVIKKLKNYWK